MTKENRQIYSILSREIVYLELKPGDKLYESEIAKRFNVSRTPIRDVFQKLEQDGLIEVYPQRGSFVSKLSLDGITDIIYIRSLVEKHVFEEYMNLATALDISKLDVIVQEAEKLADEISSNSMNLRKKIFELDFYLYETIYTRVGRKSVFDLLNSSNPSFFRYRFFAFLSAKEDIKSYLSIDRDIISALISQDKDAINDCIERHNFFGLCKLNDIKSTNSAYLK